ncbi:MAG: ABC transporter permease [Dehalococcoidia bacterium]|nr:ABC transporter permease [Dehalococcoidia bacterium]
MSIWESLRTAWQSIFANKMRSSLTMLGMVIGVCAVVLLVSLGQGFQTSITTTFNNMGASALYISSSTDKAVTTLRPLTMEDAEALEDKTLVPSVIVVSPQISSRLNVQYGNNNSSMQASGITPAIAQIRNYQVDQGRFITRADLTARSNVVVLGSQAVTDLFGTASAIGQSIRVGGAKFQVVGTLQKMGGFMGDSYVLIPITTMQSRLTGGTSIQQIAVKAVDSDSVDSAIAEVTTVLRARHFIRTGQPDDFTITDMRETLESMQATLAGFSLFMGAVGAISLLVGGIGIMNIMLVSVTERTREIGIRKAIGAKRRDILLQFLIESAAISLTGGLVGLGLAMLGAMAMGNVTLGTTQITPEISWSIIVIALAVSIGTGLISGTYPAFRAARLDPIESLRHE